MFGNIFLTCTVSYKINYIFYLCRLLLQQKAVEAIAFSLVFFQKDKKKIVVEIKYKFSINFVFNLFFLLMYCSTIQLVFFFRSFCCLCWKGLQISHGNKLLCHADNCIRSLLCLKVILYVYTVCVVFIHYSQYIVCGFSWPREILNFLVNFQLPPSKTKHHRRLKSCVKELTDCVSWNVRLMLSLYLVIFKDELVRY